MKRFFLSCFFWPWLWWFMPPAMLLEEKPIAVVIPSYNNAQWYQQNLDSIFTQKYNNYTIYYLDDCSSDGTPDLVQEYAQKKGFGHKLQLKRFTQREGKLKHMYELFHELPDCTIIVQVDGDDWLAHNQVLQKIDEVYATSDIWITYGQCQGWRSKEKIARPVPLQQLITRDFKGWWPYAHVHTFYAWLFKNIKREDLLCQDVEGCTGSFYFVGDDVAFMTPMIEMAREHFHFFNEVLYIYNDHPRAPHQQPSALQKEGTSRLLVKEILAKPPYKVVDQAVAQPFINAMSSV